jgi:anthranilate phosphoribosyltransferase
MIDALSGMESAYRNAIVYNAAAGLVIAGKATDLKHGVTMAKEAIDSGRAHLTLKKLVDISNEKI